MRPLALSGLRIEALCACLPARAVPNPEAVAKATGIEWRRTAPAGVTAVDLCVRAAERALSDAKADRASVGAVVFVSFTQPCRMPSGAAQAQHRLGLSGEVIAFDVSLACSGWAYGLYLASLLALQTGRRALLLDGDVQSAFVREGDDRVGPLLGDGGSAAVIGADGRDGPAWRFAFGTDGSRGDALRLVGDGAIEMDGFGVFRFVATDVVAFLRGFLAATGSAPADYAAFAPHQPNAYMVRQLAKALGFDEAHTALTCPRFGNLSSASVPVSLAAGALRGRILAAGFGGGLSVSAADLSIDGDCRLSSVEL